MMTRKNPLFLPLPGGVAAALLALAAVGAVAAAAAPPDAAAGEAPVVAVVGATLHPVSGPPIPGGVLVFQSDTLTAVGPAGTPTPPDARVVDATGKHVYPGFLHPRSELGLIEIGSVRGTDDTTEIGDINANVRAEVAFNADSLRLPVAVSGGVLTAHIIPGGGLFTGTSAVMRLEGWNWEDMTVHAPVGMHLTFPRVGAGGGEGDDDGGNRQMQLLKRTLEDARAYAKAREAATAGQAPAVEVDPRLEALQPVLAGELPLFLHADEKAQIEKALDWAAEEGLTELVLVTGADAAYLAERLAAEDVPVIFEEVLEEPNRDWEPYDQVFAAPGRLHAAGVRVAIGGNTSSNARNLPFNAAMAAAFGLPREEALAAVTLRPAEILGVADRLGSLAPGKEATFFIADGDPLEIRTRIEAAWIAGQEVDMGEDHQKRLYEKYRRRPRP